MDELDGQLINSNTMADIDESRLVLAESFGLKTANAAGDLVALEKSFDFTADATGVPSVAEKLINYAANGGNVLFSVFAHRVKQFLFLLMIFFADRYV